MSIRRRFGDDSIERHNENVIGWDVQTVSGKNPLDASCKTKCLPRARAGLHADRGCFRVDKDERLLTLHPFIPWRSHASQNTPAVERSVRAFLRHLEAQMRH